MFFYTIKGNFLAETSALGAFGLGSVNTPENLKHKFICRHTRCFKDVENVKSTYLKLDIDAATANGNLPEKLLQIEFDYTTYKTIIII